MHHESIKQIDKDIQKQNEKKPRKTINNWTDTRNIVTFHSL